MKGRSRNLIGLLVATAVALSLSACSEGSATPSVSPTNSTAVALPGVPGPNPRQADDNYVELCKDYVGTPGPAPTFTIAVDIATDGLIDTVFQTTVAGGTCKDVWLDDTNGLDTLTITETVPTGYTASWVLTTKGFPAGSGIVVNPSVAGNVATAVSRNLADVGSLVVFTNTEIPTPPPTGFQGCTPGYWKQEHHFDSWPAPYTPNTLFNTVFDNAFPGMTLDDVLGQGGGGLNALGRHTVAALLNAASSGVNYGMTPAQVIVAFNAVFPGGNYEALHQRFATNNERGCPLN